MHQTALETGANFFKVYCQHKAKARVVDIGSLNVNGSLRDVCPAHFDYVGIDFAQGPGVDIVLDDPYVLPLPDESADVVVCSSCFEHSEMFWLIFL
ncbi:MAG: methyltransferase domain-containing protein, partial [Longimicrobiales bacterium]